MFIHKYANSDGIKVHYMDNAFEDSFPTPLVYVPGALNFAEQTIDLLSTFNPRRIVTMSLRGRGKSDAPQTGYALENHVQDIAAVIEESKVQNYCLMAYSMGVPYAIKYAAKEENIKGLILCDYPATYPAIPETWSDRILTRGFIPEGRKHVVTGMQRDSKQTELSLELSLLDIPVLIIKGGEEGSLLKEKEVDKYKRFLKDVTICEIIESGHELWDPDKQKFIEIISIFLRKLDNSDEKEGLN